MALPTATSNRRSMVICSASGQPPPRVPATSGSTRYGQDRVEVIRLAWIVQRRAIAAHQTAANAAMHDDPRAFGVRFNPNRLHEPVAGGLAVTRDAVDVLAPQAPRTMVAKPAARQWRYVDPAVLADEPMVRPANEVLSLGHSPTLPVRSLSYRGVGAVCSSRKPGLFMAISGSRPRCADRATRDSGARRSRARP